MNTIENGHHLPSLPVLYRLAREFGVPVDEFLKPDAVTYACESAVAPMVAESVRSEDVWMASSASYSSAHAHIVRLDPPKEPLSGELVETMSAIMRSFLALEDICGVPKQAAIPLQLKIPASEGGLARYVAKVRQLFGVSDAVIFDYLELFENAGLRVLFMPLPGEIESISCYDRVNANVFLFIRQNANVERQLFRLCYELGRVYMYTGGLGGARGIGNLDAEHAARRFAAYFLMPEEAVMATVRQVGMRPDQWNWDMLMRLKHRFGVSAESFLYRLEELDLVARPVRDRLKAEIYAFYEANAYAEPDSTRRILTPNSRLGDLLLAATIAEPEHPELSALRKSLSRNGAKTT